MNAARVTSLAATLGVAPSPPSLRPNTDDRVRSLIGADAGVNFNMLFAQYTDSPMADDCVKGLGRGPWGPTDLVPFSDFLAMYDEFEALVERNSGERALFEQRNFSRAATCFEAVSARLADAEREHRGFWKYMEASAEYLRHVFDEQPGALEASLGHLERAILEDGFSSWFNRLRKAKNALAGKAEPAIALDQSAVLDRWDELVEKYPHFKGRFLKWQAAPRAYFDGTHNQVCEALQTVGIGLRASDSEPAL